MVCGGLQPLQTSNLNPETFPALLACGTQPLGGWIQGLHLPADSPSTPQEGAPTPAEEPQPQDAEPGRSPAHCCFSKEELQQILQERNELKTNLFLVQEELAYYQR